MQNENKVIRKEVWTIAIPAILESLFTVFASIIDTRMVSGMGKEAISAIAVTNQPRLFLMCVFFAINTTAAALIARNLGKKDQRKSNEIFVTSLYMAVISCIFISVFSCLFAGYIMKICSGQADTMQMSIDYFRIMMGGLIANILFILINAAMRGCGYTKITMVSNIIACLVNIFFNYCLIDGHLGFPALGVKGAAIATVMGNVAALIVSTAAFTNSGLWVNLRYCLKERVRATRDALHDIMGMWRNICTENVLLRVGFLFSSSITARIGSSDMALYSIGMTLMNISFAFGDGFQSAAVTLIGRVVGAGEQARVKSYNYMLQMSGLICSILMAALYVLLGHWYYSFFLTDLQLIRTGGLTNIIIAIICPIQVAQVIYNGVLKSMGQTRLTLISAVISVTIINPVALLILALWLKLGIWGVWASVLISQFARCMLLHIQYKREIRKPGYSPA